MIYAADTFLESVVRDLSDEDFVEEEFDLAALMASTQACKREVKKNKEESARV